MLLQEVWGPGYGSESNLLHVNVSQLRRKIEPDRARPRYLLTEPGAGYRLVDPAEPLAQQPSGLSSGAAAGTFRRRSAPPVLRVRAACSTSPRSRSQWPASRFIFLLLYVLERV